MKKIIICLIIISILFLLNRVIIGGSFSELVLDWPDRMLYKVAHSQQPIDSSQLSEAECTLQGGKWSKWGLIQKEYCQIPASDAGKTCFSGFQCQYGSCVNKSNESSIIGLGTCKTYQNPFGCYDQRRFGVGSSTRCTD